MAGRDSRGTYPSSAAPHNRRGERPSRASADGESAADPSPRLLRVLIVDDDPAVCCTLAGHLSRAGMDPTTAKDGQTCLDLLSREHYDAVVLDHRLPDVVGVTVLSRLRFRGDATPVLMLTGYPDYRTAHEVGTYANTGYEAKPIEAKDFERAVRRLLSRPPSATDEPAPLGDDPEAKPAPPDLLLKSLRPSGVEPRQVSTFIENAQRDVLLAALGHVIVDPSSSWLVVVAGCRSFRHVMTSSQRSSASAGRRAVCGWMLNAAEHHGEQLDERLTRLAGVLGRHGCGQILRNTRSIAACVDMSERSLRDLLRRELSISPRGFRLVCRARPLLAALVSTNELVSQVGYQCGYSYPSDVDRDLRRLLRASPRELRRIIGCSGTPR